MSDESPPAWPHGDIESVLPDLYMVRGAMQIAGSPLRFSRNMTIVRDDDELTLINPVRLDERGLAALDELGKVRNIVRLAGFHGRDDRFYSERYGALVHAIDGQVYVSGFDFSAEPTFKADVPLHRGDELPIRDARLYVFDGANPPEGAVLLFREGGVLVCGDALQNWARPDRFFNLPGRLMMRAMGFLRAYNVGPGWLKKARPSKEGLLGLLDLRFEHVLPAHGDPVLGNAKNRFRPAIERAAARSRSSRLAE